MMKRILLGVVAASLFAFACSGGGGVGPECTKYLECCRKLPTGNTLRDSCETSYGMTSTCGTNSATSMACESGCMSGYASLKTSVASQDGGTCP